MTRFILWVNRLWHNFIEEVRSDYIKTRKDWDYNKKGDV